jgi:hemoglobin-like flavoprotein
VIGVTPEELDLIRADGVLLGAEADAFSATFYELLFEIAPASRSLFPDDLLAQRGKLVDELTFLVDAATAGATDDLEAFIDRAHELGRRHAGYGVVGADYAAVEMSLLGALRATLSNWDDFHDAAWIRLFRLISDVMREGAAAASDTVV